MVRALVLCFALCACGARSGVSDDAPPDAGTPVGFDTFPCRWTLTQPTLVSTARSSAVFLRGGVHGTRDEVLVLAGGRQGALLGLGDPSPIIGSVELSAESVLGHREGWIARDGCQIWQSATGTTFEHVRTYEGHETCILEHNDPSHLDLTLQAPGVVTLISEHVATGTTRRVDIAHPASGTARSVRLQSLGWIVLSRAEGILRGYRVSEDGEVRGPFELGVADRLDVALDRVRPAALVLRRDPGGTWHIERVPFAEELRLLPLADLAGLDPFGTLVSNETEALFPLRDGRIAVVPIDGSALRFIGPLPEPDIREIAVIMRPGSSGGGVLYAHDTRLTFRTLTCNR